jgi:hypothetical protein
MPWILLALILPIAGIALLIRRLRVYGVERLLTPNPVIPEDDSAPLSHHLVDPEHPEDKNWANSDPDMNAP